jgi:prepilin peptidase CpaA
VIAIALMSAFLAVAVATDLLSRTIPNTLVLLMLLCGVTIQATSQSLDQVLWSLSGVAVGFVLLLPFYALGGMGAGDVKLLAAVGSFLGPWSTVMAVLLTLVAGGLLGLGILAWRTLEALPIAHRFALPRLSATTEINLPYSVAITAGSLVSLIQC